VGFSPAVFQDPRRRIDRRGIVNITAVTIVEAQFADQDPTQF